MQAVFLDRGSFSNTTQFDLPQQLTDYTEYKTTENDTLVERIQNADIIIVNKVILNAETLSTNPNIKLILVAATGTNNVDIKYCSKNNIQVENVEGYATTSVPEHTFSLLLALKRNLLTYHHAIQAGKWAQSEHFCLHEYPINDLADSHMVIFGRGSLGQRVATIAQAFGMKVSFCEHKQAEVTRPGYMKFEEAIAMADVISLHCPLDENNKNMIAEHEFNMMKNTCVLINTGRGGLVCEQALVDAINHKKIAAAGFDVATIEPMPENHILQKLTHAPNFLLTPHVAWASDKAMQLLADKVMENLDNFLNKQHKFK